VVGGLGGKAVLTETSTAPKFQTEVMCEKDIGQWVVKWRLGKIYPRRVKCSLKFAVEVLLRALDHVHVFGLARILRSGSLLQLLHCCHFGIQRHLPPHPRAPGAIQPDSAHWQASSAVTEVQH
jgi:hypothetical protein